MALLPPRIARSAHRALATNPSQTAAALPQTCLAAHRQQGRGQRRDSSSKASCPPNNDGKNAPATKPEAASDGASNTSATVRPAKRMGKSKRSSENAERQTESFDEGKKREEAEKFAGLPSVPGVQHLHSGDISVSSFFSLHRPLSLTPPIPPPSTQQDFEQIFTPPTAQTTGWENGNSAERRPEDIIFTLHPEALQQNTQTPRGKLRDAEGEEADLRWEIVNESSSNNEQQGSVRHLDGAPTQQPFRMKSLEEVVANFKPFRAPPPPQAFPLESHSTSNKQTSPTKPTRKTSAKSTQAKKKSYTTTIVVTESTSADGQRTWSASSSPIVRIPEPTSSTMTTMREPRRPYLERMRKREIAYLSQKARAQQIKARSSPLQALRRSIDGGRTKSVREPGAKGGRRRMLLISVKRQRKLKMKKHKYKKLMKRTRNLRRRLERA